MTLDADRVLSPWPGWHRLSFEQAFEVISDHGQRLSQRAYSSEGSLRVVDQGAGTPPAYTDDVSLQYTGPLPVLVFGDHTRRVKYVDHPFVVGAQGVKLLKPRPILDLRFAYWLLRATPLDDRGYGRHFGLLRRQTFSVPPLEEQRSIVDTLEDHLSRLDAASGGLWDAARRLALLEEQTLRQELTGGCSLPAVPAALPAADCDDGLLPDLPEGWAWRRLQDVATVVGGVTKDVKKQSDPSLPEWPYLRVANVQRGRLDLSVVSTIRVAEYKAATLFLQPGDVLLNEGGDRDKLGRGWVWEGQIQHCIHQNHVFRARIVDDAIEPRLLSWAANSLGGAWCERNGKQSVNLASISLSKIRLLPVPVPPRELQPTVVARLDRMLTARRRLAAAVEAAEQRTSRLRRSLLASAFAGTLTRIEPVLAQAGEFADG